MKPISEFLNKIILGYCLEVMKEIPDESVDLIVTDPPYYKVMITDWKGNKYEWDNQWESLDDYIQWIGLIGKEIKRVMKPNGSFYIFVDDKVGAYVQVELDKYDWVLLNRIIWVKRNNLTKKGWSNKRTYSAITEHILFYGYPEKDYKDLRRPFNIDKNYTDVWEYIQTPIGERTGHPTQKPEIIIGRIIRVSSNENDIVLDPFIGSGTTAVACKQLGRNYIGIEKSEEYYKIAVKRVDNTVPYLIRA